ncbi:DinB family protein [Priestia endophytica]|jgi:hypothetical protein|uniref:DinB superfamily protein n=1 Tax=Priestia endophytica DSM 13796 TaxID=1121089 RepID=A0A1I6BZ48_9BACI|nr:DinB family protein [Priestia endophytica]KAB2493424.1 DinB family protein [Priestia endophytica]KYG29196.1 hypothetical protein AZF06_24820 [Priestia endophytica]MBG9812436.1 hypothetical protein [Priestia endophytica]SFQ86164.1 DinB superfamily protein [Priestia endophytica DSM 13796]
MDTTINELRENIKFQFSISKQLLEYHLTSLGSEEYLWRPYKNGLHIHNQNGIWYADWPESEDYDIGTASIAWTMWHISYWWEMVFDYAFGKGTLQRQDIVCYGDVESTKEKLVSLITKWEKVLTDLPDNDFLSTKYSKWPLADVEFHKMASWLNLELMKNASEIGYCRFHFASEQKK